MRLPGTLIASVIVPTDSLDEHATHDEKWGKGGFRSVDTLGERDAITLPRRREGMLVWVKDEDRFYHLKGSVDNSSWVHTPIGGAGDVVIPFQQALAVVSDGQTAFPGVLGRTPFTSDNAIMLINGASYDNTHFKVEGKSVTWLSTRLQGGFDLETTDEMTIHYYALKL